MNAPAKNAKNRKALRGMPELLIEPPKKAVRKPDPPSRAQAARERLEARERGHSRQDILNQIERLAIRLAAAPAPAPPPPTVPKPPGPPPPPPPRKLTWDDRCGWHIPCSLTAEQLALGMPSEQTLRFMRAARDKYEAEAKQRAPHQ
jgi:hypothetical protein